MSETSSFAAPPRPPLAWLIVPPAPGAPDWIAAAPERPLATVAGGFSRTPKKTADRSVA
jgi:hypothetical protein